MSLSLKNEDSVTGWVLLVAFVISLLFLFFSRQDARSRQAAPDFASETISPISTLISGRIRSFESFVFNFKDRSRAFEENKVLRAELEQLRLQKSYLNEMKFKIARYEEILSVPTDMNFWQTRLVGRVVSENKGPFVRAMLINLGRKQGVQVGNPVISVDGLIGHVIAVGEGSSRILLLGDLNSRIPVMSAETRARAILAGDNSDMPNLIHVGTPQDWSLGHEVMTSGDDGMLPQGLPVGYVFRDGDGRLRVKLQTEDTILDWVWVVPYIPLDPPSEARGIEDAIKQNVSDAEREETQAGKNDGLLNEPEMSQQ